MSNVALEHLLIRIHYLHLISLDNSYIVKVNLSNDYVLFLKFINYNVKQSI